MCNSVAWIVWYHGVVYRMSDWEVGGTHAPCTMYRVFHLVHDLDFLT